MTDLRMGLEPGYAFRFKVGEQGNPHAKPLPVEQLPSVRQIEKALMGLGANLFAGCSLAAMSEDHGSTAWRHSASMSSTTLETSTIP